VLSGDGRPLGPADIMMVPGPGAAPATRERFTARKRASATTATSAVSADR
jgi:hypothetical protein